MNNQVKGGTSSGCCAGERTTILELLASEDEALLVGRRAATTRELNWVDDGQTAVLTLLEPESRTSNQLMVFREDDPSKHVAVHRRDGPFMI